MGDVDMKARASGTVPRKILQQQRKSEGLFESVCNDAMVSAWVRACVTECSWPIECPILISCTMDPIFTHIY